MATTGSAAEKERSLRTDLDRLLREGGKRSHSRGKPAATVAGGAVAMRVKVSPGFSKRGEIPSLQIRTLKKSAASISGKAPLLDLTTLKSKKTFGRRNGDHRPTKTDFTYFQGGFPSVRLQTSKPLEAPW